MDLATLVYEANSIPTDEKDTIVDDPVIDNDNSGCKKEAILLIVSLISLSTSIVLFRKRK